MTRPGPPGCSGSASRSFRDVCGNTACHLMGRQKTDAGAAGRAGTLPRVPTVPEGGRSRPGWPPQIGWRIVRRARDADRRTPGYGRWPSAASLGHGPSVSRSHGPRHWRNGLCGLEELGAADCLHNSKLRHCRTPLRIRSPRLRLRLAPSLRSGPHYVSARLAFGCGSPIIARPQSVL